MALYFISDLHLRGDVEPKARAFAAFLAKETCAGDIVVLGGDIFDLFVGDKAFFRTVFAGVITAIKGAASRGAQVYFLEGNHDFHVRAVFSGDAPVDVRTDEFALEWDGKKIWVCHGDEINRRDYGYLFLRFITRTWFFRALLGALPGSWIAAIGGWSSGVSREYSDVARADAGRIEATRALFREYARAKTSAGFALVLIGHSHIADNLSFGASGGSHGAYVNLGFKQREMPYLKLSGAIEGRELGLYTESGPQ